MTVRLFDSYAPKSATCKLGVKVYLKHLIYCLANSVILVRIYYKHKILLPGAIFPFARPDEQNFSFSLIFISPSRFLLNFLLLPASLSNVCQYWLNHFVLGRAIGLLRLHFASSILTFVFYKLFLHDQGM